MLARNGNMADVYREFWRMHDVAQQAERSMNDAARAATALEAEITEGTTADWYLVQTVPGDDMRAMRWLARRRFGIFRPMQQRTDKRNGQKVQGLEPAFPGWLFVYTWDIGKMHGRLVSCPGVMGILSTPDGRPVGVDQIAADGVSFIDRLRALSWIYEDNAPRLQRHQPNTMTVLNKASRPTARRPTKCERKTLDRLKKSLKKQSNWDASTWECANLLAPHLRIALLQRFVHGPAV